MTRATDLSVAVAFASHFGLPRQGARALALLYRHAPEAIPATALAQALGTSRGGLSFCIHGLRQSLDCEAIDCTPDHGYRLTEIGFDECRHAIRTVVAELAEAA